MQINNQTQPQASSKLLSLEGRRQTDAEVLLIKAIEAQDEKIAYLKKQARALEHRVRILFGLCAFFLIGITIAIC